MKELDLMHALEGVEDDILRDSERFEFRPRRRVLPRLVAAAAAAALLCGTVYAAVMGVKVDFNGKTWVYHHEGLNEQMLYSEMEASFILTEQTVPAESMEFLEDYLNVHWRASRERWPIGDGVMGMVTRGGSFLAGCHWDYVDGEVHRPKGVKSHYFQSWKKAETFFGIDFALPECVCAAALGSCSVVDEPGILLEVLTPPLTSEEEIGSYLTALSGEAAAEQIVPGFAELSFRADDPTPELDGISGSVIIALNGDAAGVEYSTELSVALDYVGEPGFRTLDIAGLDGTLVVFPPCDTDPGAVNAWYTCDGVGYILYAHLREGVDTEDPAQLLLPLLEQMK